LGEEREEDRVFYPGRIPGQNTRAEYMGRRQGHPLFGEKEEERVSAGRRGLSYTMSYYYYELL
jgi:hypothetical protein